MENVSEGDCVLRWVVGRKAMNLEVMGGSPGLLGGAILEGLDINRFLRDCAQRCLRVSEGSWKVREGEAVLQKKAP